MRSVTVAPFLLDRVAVSNARFATFVEASGYVTEAERHGCSFVFFRFLPKGRADRLQRPLAAPWWRAVPGADWRRPEGPGSGLHGREDHPVVHVSLADALAYCAWLLR